MIEQGRVLCVVAHPDDETIGCGGTLSYAARHGSEVTVLLTVQRTHQRGRENWAKSLGQFSRACDRLGARAVLLPELVPDEQVEHEVSRLHDGIVPWVEWATTILTHWPLDTHQAHRGVARAVEIATRPFRRRRNVAHFEIATSTDQAFMPSFQPNLFVLLDECDVAKKAEAMSYYDTELAIGRTPRDLALHLRHRGLQVGAECAEALFVSRSYAGAADPARRCDLPATAMAPLALARRDRAAMSVAQGAEAAPMHRARRVEPKKRTAAAVPS